MLGTQINSLEYRGQSPGKFPHWKDWDEDQMRKFERFALNTMKRMGYAKNPSTGTEKACQPK